MIKYRTILMVAIGLAVAGCGRQSAWRYQGELHKLIAGADRIVVRDGGFKDADGSTDDRILFEVTAPSQVKEVLENLELRKKQDLSRCACPGYPRLDWYQGKQRIALTSIQHGRAIRWKGFRGDAQLTGKSAEWLVHWLSRQGVDPNKIK